VGLDIHYPIRLHGVVLNELSTGTTLRYLLSAIYGLHQVKYLHSLSTFLLFSFTLANVYLCGRSYILFADVNDKD
jgi:hypothetical protein